MANVAEVLQDIWTNDETKQRLFASPREFLHEHGVDVPKGMQVKIHEDVLSQRHFVLPEKLEGEIPESEDPVLKVLKRAHDDAAFRRSLLADANAAVKSAGVELPAGMKVQVFENSADTLHLVLPMNPADAELSDEDLEAVAGGMSKAGQAATGCGTIATVGAAGQALDFTAVGAAIATGMAVGGAAASVAAGAALDGK